MGSTGTAVPHWCSALSLSRRHNRGMQGRDGCWGPGGCRLQLAGQPSATPRPNGYLYTTHGRVPALVSPPAARPPDPQPAPPTLSPPSPSAGGSVRGRVAMASQVSLGAARSSYCRSCVLAAAASPDHRSRGGQSGVRRANPPAQAWQRQQPAAAAAASGEPAPRGGGRAGAARSSSARRRSFPNSPSPRAPRWQSRRAREATAGSSCHRMHREARRDRGG